MKYIKAIRNIIKIKLNCYKKRLVNQRKIKFRQESKSQNLV